MFKTVDKTRQFGGTQVTNQGGIRHQIHKTYAPYEGKLSRLRSQLFILAQSETKNTRIHLTAVSIESEFFENRHKICKTEKKLTARLRIVYTITIHNVVHQRFNLPRHNAVGQLPYGPHQRGHALFPNKICAFEVFQLFEHIDVEFREMGIGGVNIRKTHIAPDPASIFKAHLRGSSGFSGFISATLSQQGAFKHAHAFF